MYQPSQSDCERPLPEPMAGHKMIIENRQRCAEELAECSTIPTMTVESGSRAVLEVLRRHSLTPNGDALDFLYYALKNNLHTIVPEILGSLTTPAQRLCGRATRGDTDAQIHTSTETHDEDATHPVTPSAQNTIISE